jgi:UDP-glucose 4-epimerase
MDVLVTGGAGYIGSTITSALEDAGHTPIILDSLVTGSREFVRNRNFYHGDIIDKNLLEAIFSNHPNIYAVIHCAALIVVPESVIEPFKYYSENVSKSLILFKNLNNLGCKRIVFSSSASVYDATPSFEVVEESPLKPSSPYARTKYIMELILEDMANSLGFRGIALRYFNPIGADPKLRSGIHARNPSHVLGKLVQVAMGLEPEFLITGTNWATRDGSGIRDYIHVWDLAQAHVKAVENFDLALAKLDSRYAVINVGSGSGVTVRELVAAFERVYGESLTIREVAPRPGDVAGAYANTNKALQLINWQAALKIDDGIQSALEWMTHRKTILGY